MRAEYKARNGGFTLIELLISLALLGLVISAIYSFYFNSLQAWQRSIDRVEYQQSARIAMNKIIKELQHAYLVKCCINEEHDCTGTIIDLIFFRSDLSGTSTRYSFRLNNDQLHLDHRRESSNKIRASNVIALGISNLEFLIDESETVHVKITAGEGTGAISMSGAITPRNLKRFEPCPEDDEPVEEGVNEH